MIDRERDPAGDDQGEKHEFGVIVDPVAHEERPGPAAAAAHPVAIDKATAAVQQHAPDPAHVRAPA